MSNYVLFYILVSSITTTVVIITLCFNRKWLRLGLANPILWLTISTFIGTFGQAIYVIIFNNKLSDYKFAAGYSPNEIAPFLMLVPVGVISWTLGYVIFNKTIDISNLEIFRTKTWSVKSIIALNILIIMTTMVSIYGFTKYVIEEGALIDLVFRKIEVNVGEDSFSSLGHFRWLTFPSLSIALVNYAYIINNANNKLTKITLTVLMLINISLYFVIPIISSVRTPILYALLAILIFHSIQRGIHLFKSALIGIALIFVLVSLANLRKLSQEGQLSEFSVDSFTSGILDNTIGSGNGLPLFPTAIVSKFGPSILGYQYGFTYISAVTGFVPRVLWPQKPDISPEADILDKIYNIPARRSGRPPGFIAEAVLNYGGIGILPISFILGAIHRLYINSFYPLLLKKNDAAAIVYSTGMLYFFVNIWQLSFGLGFISFAVGTLCSALVIKAVKPINVNL